jgi:hypothetical protein
MPRNTTLPRSAAHRWIRANNRRSATVALLVLPLVCLGLGACGSSSGGSSSSSSSSAKPASTSAMAETTPATTASAPASTTPTSTGTTSTSTEPTIRTARQFQLVYECLRNSGINLPPLKSLKSIGEVKVNTNTPQYKAALASCRKKVLGG